VLTVPTAGALEASDEFTVTRPITNAIVAIAKIATVARSTRRVRLRLCDGRGTLIDWVVMAISFHVPTAGFSIRLIGVPV
jgi:hypothetical protein